MEKFEKKIPLQKASTVLGTKIQDAGSKLSGKSFHLLFIELNNQPIL
jgi:hypothetical protein